MCHSKLWSDCSIKCIEFEGHVKGKVMIEDFYPSQSNYLKRMIEDSKQLLHTLISRTSENGSGTNKINPTIKASNF